MLNCQFLYYEGLVKGFKFFGGLAHTGRISTVWCAAVVTCWAHALGLGRDINNTKSKVKKEIT